MFFLARQEKKKKREQEKIPVFGVLLLFFGMFLSSLLFFSSPVSAATPPSIITYQGKLLDDGTAVNATTSIQLRIYDDIAAGNFLYTASGTTGAPAALSVPVDNGIFSVNMGGSDTNSLSDSIFAQNTTLYLEVWIEGNQLSPRKRLTATPYALNSSYLMGYGAATVSTTTYIPVSDATGNFNFSGSIIATGTATSSFTNVLINDGITLGGEKRTTWPASGSSDISSSTNNTFTGRSTFSSTTIIQGKISEPSLFASYTSSTIMDGASGVALQGDYAFVTAFLDDRLNVIDVSSSTNPQYVSGLSIGSRPTDVVIQGNYAYVTLYFDSAVAIVDISNPHDLSLITTVVDPGNLSGPRGMSVRGNYLYVVASDSNKLSIIDITNPNDLEVVGTIADGAGGAELDEPWSVFVSGKYAYVASETSDSLAIIDISDPRNPRHMSSIVDGGGVAPFLEGAHSLAVSGKYAYVGNIAGAHKGIQILDISDPTSITSVSSTGNIGAVMNVVANQDYLYAFGGGIFYVFDISDPFSPTSLGFTFANLGHDFSTQHAMVIQGNKLYASGYLDARLSIYDITGAVITNVEAGNAAVSNLGVKNNAEFNNYVSIRGGLSVGNSGLLLHGDFSMMTATNSVSATNTLRFTNTTLFETSAVVTDTHAFIFNTANSFSNVSTTYLFSVRNNGTSAFAIAANGNVHATGSYYGVSANLGTPGAPGDLAERVDIAQDDVVEAGDVVVVDPNSTDTYRRSHIPYSQEVSGVISTNPTIVVGNGRTQHTAVMAMVGRVPIKVSDENGPIVRGDLLITASSTGHAMRYDPTKDVGGKIAGIVGVALESLPEGKGKIMGLVRTGWVNGQDQQIFSEMRNEISKLSLGQTVNNELNVSENSNGSIARIQNDVDLNGFSLLSVKSIQGFNGKWQIDEEGRFTTKVETTDGSKTLYALQTGESQYVFSGNGQLQNGKTRIEFDQTIQDIVDTEKPMSINLTLTQKAKGVYVSQRDATGFEVEEIGGGESNATFDWLIFATRKDGDEDEVIDEDEPEEQGEPVVEDPEQNPGEENIEGDQPEVDLEAENGEENANDDLGEIPLPNEGQDNTPDNIAPDPLEQGEIQPVEGEVEEPIVEVLDPEPVVEESNI